MPLKEPKKELAKEQKQELALVLLRNDPTDSIPEIYAEAFELLSLASAGLLSMALVEIDALPDRIIRQWGEINAIRHDVAERQQELEEERTKAKSK